MDSSWSDAQTDFGKILTTENSLSKISTIRSESIVQLKASGEPIVVMNAPIQNTNLIPRNKNDKKLALKSSDARREFSDEVENVTRKEHFKKMINKTSWILFGIAAMFLICNLPRIAHKVFHIYFEGRNVQKHFMKCFGINKLHAPAFVQIMSKLYFASL